MPKQTMKIEKKKKTDFPREALYSQTVLGFLGLRLSKTFLDRPLTDAVCMLRTGGRIFSQDSQLDHT